MSVLTEITVTDPAFNLVQDIYYLESIHHMLRQDMLNIEFGPTLYTEALADNTNWLDDYISKLKEKLNE